MVCVSFLEGPLCKSIVDLGRFSWCCYGRMAGKNVNVQGGKSCADRFAMLIFSKGKKISRNILF